MLKVRNLLFAWPVISRELPSLFKLLYVVGSRNRPIPVLLDFQSALLNPPTSSRWLFSYERCGPKIFWYKPGSMLELLDTFQALAEQHPSLQSICVACCQCEIEDWRMKDIERNLNNREKKEKQKTKTQNNLQKTKDFIATGEHLRNIGILAEIYFANHSYVDGSLPPVDRLRETIGQKYVDLASPGKKSCKFF